MLALDLISDILINPTFDEAELEREREVILQEIGQTRDTPDDLDLRSSAGGLLSQPADGLADLRQREDRRLPSRATI